ncbi:NAD(P)/FAD-dependent oxidoreductase [Pseudoxanthomonas dokdonensis]|uniref:Amino acid oxidase n=1 Tax=Pseudoxanthomonas dokdonensis TaxID=344882 RepID=A0A0R0CIV4_9GAMM|nr:FAD-dependent oxidoreductase [Pseudoxanthomonas dokdonensis]KRG69836.1 amino acid oxidase [Pseudoxanthomonas dokdonensis]
MDLKSGYPFWAVKNGLMQAFPPLRTDLRCEVAVIGGGITGALIADELSSHGIDVAVFEQRDIAWGSTAASTALLQYEIDTPMATLARQYGEDNAVLAYRACAEAIPLLQAKARSLRDVDFARVQSLYYASRRRHVDDLREEFALRRKHGFDLQWLSAEALDERFQLKAPAALLTALAASVDPYRFCYRLFGRLQRRGVSVHDRTAIERITPTPRGVDLVTAQGHAIRAGHVVMAAGYANQRWLRHKVASNRSSYAFITDPLPAGQLDFLTDTVLWETARPYLYLRTTGDNRLLVGGQDDTIDVPARRDARVEKKTRKLVKQVQALFPQLPVQPAFSWAGTFAETDDGLPFFGAHPDSGKRVLLAMAYGGNGITYSAIGAGIIRAAIQRQPHPLAQLFSFNRID